MAGCDGVRQCSHGSCYEIVFSIQFSVFSESHGLTLLNTAVPKLKTRAERQ